MTRRRETGRLMSQIVLGKSGNRDAKIDLDVLLRTRLLIQANSGGGKSWILRRLAEQLFGKVQVIIIDPEGEFATLREKFGFVLVGDGGETPADPRSAALLAEKLLELRASAVCDLFEAFRKNPQGRHSWVKNFCNGLLDAPKKFWHPVVLLIDEFHKFVPEKGADESEASEAVIGCGTAGRKRGICLVGATQRLGKVRKDVSAELLNRLVGPTFEDIDVKRAADLLSVLPEQQKQFFAEMRTLEPGNFYAFGRAISKERVLVHVGPVETSHPEMGSAKHAAQPPPPPEKVRELLPKLADLPKAAEERAKTEFELRAEIRSLKAQLRAQQIKTETKTIQVLDQKAVERAVKEATSVLLREIERRNQALRNLARDLAKLSAEGDRISTIAGEWASMFEKLPEAPKPLSGGVAESVSRRTPPAPVRQPTDSTRIVGSNSENAFDGEVRRTPLKILRALTEFEALGRVEVARPTLASWCGVKHTTGTFSNYLSELRTRALVEDSPDKTKLRLTDAGRGVAGPAQAPITTDEMLGRCLAIMKGTPAKMLKALHDRHPEYLSYEDLGQSLNPPISGDTGTFSNYISALNVAEMIEKGANRTVRCADWLFID
jgi:hypothetical protein